MKLPDVLPIQPLTRPPRATISMPGSKSITNRALLLAAMAQGRSVLHGALWADDTKMMVDSLTRLGFRVRVSKENKLSANRRIEVEGGGGQIPSKKASLFVGNAGTVARFLTAFVATDSGEFCIDGTPRMRERPMGELFDALRSLGAEIKCERREGHFPVTIHASGLRGTSIKIRADESSQFASALLMIAPLIQNPSTPHHSLICHPERNEVGQVARQTKEILRSAQNHSEKEKAPTSALLPNFIIELNGAPVSEPYLWMTQKVMVIFGGKIMATKKGWRIWPDRYRPQQFAVPADASAASYFESAAALCGGSVTIEGLSRRFEQTLQGDTAFADYLEKLGCHVSERNGLRLTGPMHNGKFFAHPLDMSDISDVAITLAVLAPFLSRPTTIRGLAHARLQETDRVAAVAQELAKVGVLVDCRRDGWTIYPTRQFHPATIDTYNDHRIAMAFSILGLKDMLGNGKPWISIRNPACVNKTFPDFFKKLRMLRIRD